MHSFLPSLQADPQQVKSHKRTASEDIDAQEYGAPETKRKFTLAKLQEQQLLKPDQTSGKDLQQPWSLSSSDQRGQHRLSQEFAQEFHQSVLQSTKQALAQKQGTHASLHICSVIFL